MSEIQENQKVPKVELASTIAGGVAILAGIYFTFLRSENHFRLVNIIIAVAFLTFVVYNFLVATSAKSVRAQLVQTMEQNEQLRLEKESLQKQLTQTEGSLRQTSSELAALQKECADLREKMGQA